MKNPISYFRLLFDSEMVKSIADQIDRYSTQTNTKNASVAIRPDEIENFLGILLRMRIVQMPRYRMYKQQATRFEVQIEIPT